MTAIGVIDKDIFLNSKDYILSFKRTLENFKALKHNNEEQLSFKKKCSTLIKKITEFQENKEIFNCESVFPILLEALETNVPTFVSESLDFLQKLLSWSCFVGFIDDLVLKFCACFQEKKNSMVHLQILKILLTSTTSKKYQINEVTMLNSIKTCYDIFVISSDTNVQVTAKASLCQIVNATFERLKEKEFNVENNSNHKKDFDDQWASFFSIKNFETIFSSKTLSLSQINARLTFKMLCRLCDSGVYTSESHTLKANALSLELLLLIIKNNIDLLTQQEEFLSLIKYDFCTVLYQNGASTDETIFMTTLSLFNVLLFYFKAFLKPQIEFFFQHVVLFILESSVVSLHHKLILLHAMYSLIMNESFLLLTRLEICSTSQIVVDIYINYDCDLASINIFTKLLLDLGKIVQKNLTFEATQKDLLKIKGLECLIAIIVAMVDWINAHEEKHLENEDNTEEIILNEKNNKIEKCESLIGIDNPENLEQNRKIKLIREDCVRNFNRNAFSGIESMQNKKLLGLDPFDVANFLKTENNLDKTIIGEYLGNNDPFCIKVAYCYIQRFDFTNMELLEALRLFLENFLLPGEGQKIDRLIEIFSAKYVEDNPGVYVHADTAYCLAYSIIMLTTDLHNKSVKLKMSKEQFLINNKGIDNNKDLPREYLESLYDEIAKEGITVKQHSLDKKVSLKESMKSKAKIEHFQYQLQGLSKNSTLNFLKENTEFISASYVEHIQSMFLLAWPVYLASLSIYMKETSDPKIVQLCLLGFQNAIYITAYFNMNIELNSFVSTLSKFTFFQTYSVEEKQIECFKVLLTVCSVVGNNLEGTWFNILKSISQFENYQSTFRVKNSSNLPMDINRLNEFNTQLKTSNEKFQANSELIYSRDFSYNKYELFSERKKTNEANSHLNDMEPLIDKVLLNSIHLNGEKILEFVHSCCAISLLELKNPKKPCTFFLHKIVEIAYSNMNRIRLEWSKVWEILCEYFKLVCCMKNRDLVMLAIDSLRQLAIKFLEKEEFAHFHFQKDFFVPFEFIIINNNDIFIKDFIVRCLFQFIKTHGNHLKSGWQTIFLILSYCAKSEKNEIVVLAFTVLTEIQKTCFSFVFNHSFVDCLNCIMEYSLNSINLEIQKTTISLVEFLAFDLNEQKLNIETKSWIQGWLPLLLTLNNMIVRCRWEVKENSLTAMIGILKKYNSCFKENWSDIIDILLRLFNNQKVPENPHEKKCWLENLCSHSISQILEFLETNWTFISYPTLKKILHSLEWCITNKNTVLSSIAIKFTTAFLLKNYKTMNAIVWEEILIITERFFSKLFFSELVSSDDPMSNLLWVGNQSKLIKMVGVLLSHQDIVDHLSSNHLLRLAICLNQTYSNSESNIAQLTKISKDLTKHKILAQRHYVKILFQLGEDKNRKGIWGIIRKRIIIITENLLETFIERVQTDSSTDPSNTIFLLKKISVLSNSEFGFYLQHFKQHFSTLVSLKLKNDHLRAILSKIFVRLSSFIPEKK